MTTKMRRVLIAVVATALLILVVGLVIDRSVDWTARTAGASSPASASDSSGEGSDGEASAAPEPDAGATDPPGSSGDDGPGKEVLAPLPTQTGLPSPIVHVPLVSDPLPVQASADGALVEGFPEAVPVFAGSEIVSSAVSPHDGRLQAAFEATTDAAPQPVLDYYTSEFGKLGLGSTTAPAVGGSRALAFANGGDSIVVTVTPVPGGTRYTLSSTLTAAEG
ncbi:hypothetical protein ACFVTX_05260 [Agromyces sp. NPDC058136]|uniref:hypothetical protein n=1 Tax=Agromyces sp. NPDC058136 TaxID=3346354 RepID=UPI0036DCCDE7